MKYRLLFVVCVMSVVAANAKAQSRTVTNADLEKYRQARLDGEREYRENYQRLGLPSPDELDRRRQQSFVDAEKLSSKLRTERLETERIEIDRQTNERLAASAYVADGVDHAPRFYEPPYFYSYGFQWRHRPRIPYVQTGHIAGGQFWPTGPKTKPRPAFVRPPSPRR